jgi:proton-dependent oligopeptide transporter, POT family
MSQTANPAVHEPPSGNFLGHPKGLFVLFFTEMWERFSYYGMRSLLVLYMVNFLFIQPDVGKQILGFNAVKGTLEHIFGHLDIQPLSSQIYGLYTAFVYLTPLFGGMLADKVLGQRKSVIIGGVLMAIGEFTLMSPHLFFPGLLLLIIGNGAFKPNISTQVGGLYREGDSRRDGAFTIFYMGINLGAFLAPLVPGTLGQRVGWRWGFCAAGGGMIVGLSVYLWGQRYLAADLKMQQAAADADKKSRQKVKQPMTRDEWMSIGGLLVLCALNIVFWGCYEQQGNTMQLWADRYTNWNLFGFNVPSTWFQAFNPMMIFAFAPLLTMFWAWQNKSKKEPSSVTKMALGCFMLGLSYIVMIVAAAGLGEHDKRNVMWLVGTTFMITIGELYLSPIGLSLVTKVAPKRMVSMMMGAWFLSSFFGNYMCGFLGTFWDKWNLVQLHVGPVAVAGKQVFFVLLTSLGLGTGILMMVVNRPLRRIMDKHEVVTH